MKLILIMALTLNISMAATGGAGHVRSNSLNTNTLAGRLGPTYGEGTGTFFTDLAGVSMFSLYNGSSLGTIGISFPKGSETCVTGAPSGFNTKEFSVPASTGFTPPKEVAINKYACVRSKSGSSLTSGTVELSIW